jgi:hypothetical protein
LKPTLNIVRKRAVHDAALHDGPAHAAARCPNCGAPAQDTFCSRCGETVIVHSPSASEFLHEFVGHYVALEGKLWQTLRLLITRPGQLTAEHLRGRRIPYINPLRLYLTLSLLLFALIRLVGIELPQVTLDNKSMGISYAHTVPDPAHPGKPITGTLYVQVSESGGGDLGGLRETLTLLRGINKSWTVHVQDFMASSPQEKAELLNHGFMANLPYMLIGALPLLALYLKLMYWRSGRRYGEHLVFALHVTAFGFLLAIVMIVLPGNFGWLLASLEGRRFGLISAWDCVQLLPVAWILVYLPAAIRRVYGGSSRAAWARSLVLMGVHGLVILALMAGAEIVAILKHA